MPSAVRQVDSIAWIKRRQVTDNKGIGRSKFILFTIFLELNDI